jgi:hypothetical protein
MKSITEVSTAGDSIAVSEEFIVQEIRKEAYLLYKSGVYCDPYKDWQEAERIVKNHFRYLAARE